MNRRRLGTSDLWVSELSFGCMSLDVNSPTSEQLVHSAYNNGINFFDTADLYDFGENEALIGRALNSVRDQVIIATKVGNKWRENGAGWDWNPTKTYILQAVNNSLRRLNTDYIDLYQLHGGTIDDPIDEAIEAFEILKQQGKIREYGISSIRPNVIREWVKRSNISTVMMQYSLLDRRPEEEILDLLHNHNISVITRGTLAKGLLVNKPPKAFLNYSKVEVDSLQDALKKTGNPIAFAIRYILQHPSIGSAVLGMRTNEQLISNLSALNDVIDTSVLENLAACLSPKVYEKHR